ncbi:MAG TPA: septum formation initiator family protein [Gaiellaceae bacterium]|nr:septum formation initiator family protein [Gaiellaceae bacterium]
MAAKRKKRPSRSSLLRRWLALGALAACAFLYYQPLTAYLEKRREVAVRAAEVATLQQERASLERQLAERRSDATIVADARRMAYVKPGEQLFVVKGIPEWRRARAAARPGATIGGDG